MSKYPRATPQDPIVEIFPNIYLLRGSIKLGPMLQMNRNMLIVKQGHDLSLINPVRLNQQGLEQLAHLGRVKHVIRLGDFHGLDDQFYIDRYQASFWSQADHQGYAELLPTHIIQEHTRPPIARSQFFIFHSARFPEAALFLEESKLLITTDSIQYWSDWKYMTFFSKIILFLMGFRLGLFVGGPWLKKVSTHKNSLERDFNNLLKLDFEHLVAAHGNVLKGDAKIKTQQVLQATFKSD